MGKPMDIVYIPDENGNFMPTRVPTSVGFIGLYAGPEPPEGYLYCDGSAIGRETYRELFDAIGTLYGVGDGVSTFELPDARGIFFRGDGGNAAAMGTRQGDAIRNITASAAFRVQATDINIGDIYAVALGAFIQQATDKNGPYDTLRSQSSLRASQKLVFDASAVVPTATENRPINLAMKPCIRYV